MCAKCDEIDDEIIRYKRIGSRTNDKILLEGLAGLLEKMMAEKASLHPDEPSRDPGAGDRGGARRRSKKALGSGPAPFVALPKLRLDQRQQLSHRRHLSADHGGLIGDSLQGDGAAKIQRVPPTDGLGRPGQPLPHQCVAEGLTFGQ